MKSTRTQRYLTLALGILAGIAIAGQWPRAASAADALPALYTDVSKPIDARVDDLLGRLTLEEKISQLNNDSRAIPRLGIPAYNVWNEALHGVARDGLATVFPQAIGLAATFDAPLIREMGGTISAEARAKHALAMNAGHSLLYEGLTFFSPNINIFRDPRWGRGQETYGEDPYLTGRMAVAFITGMQGSDPVHLRVGTTAKHFAVHSGPDPLRHAFDARPSAHDLEDTYLPAFRTAVIDGKVASIMCVYNAVDGIPGCANTFLLQKTLREDWKFKGFVVSDCNAVNDINGPHHYVKTDAEAAAAALKAGVDNECTVKAGPHPEDYAKYADAVQQGLITVKDVDRAVRRVLRARFALGMFDPPDAAAVAAAPAQIDTTANRALALQIARESMVLLKNSGVLPIAAAPQHIAVVGPLADNARVLEGNYNGTPSRVTTVLEGLKHQFPGSTITYEPGTIAFLRAEALIPASALSTDDGQPGLTLQYFTSPERTGAPVLTRVEKEVNLRNTGDGRDRYARWHGYLTPSESGDYRIEALGEANQISLDGKLIVNTQGGGTAQRMSFTTVTLEKGHKYAIRVDNNPSLTREVRLVWARKDPDALRKAVAASQAADMTIAVVGLTADLEGEESALDIPGFKGGDRTTLDLPAEEEQLLESVKQQGKPLVVVLMSGSGLAVNWAHDHADAILQAWYPGEEGGRAVAETLAGVNDPAGRLPVTFYTGVSQLPDFADYAMKNRTYRYFTGSPLYAFGFGLSYTQFAYADLMLSSHTVQAGQPLNVQVQVRNTGKRDGDEVVELYLSFGNAAGAPLHALRAFQRVHLKAGASQLVKMTLSPRDLSHVDDAGHHVVSAGQYEVSVGGGLPQGGAAGVSDHFAVTGERQLPR
ncbi:MAG TPA: glycoside hydrolase family 3 C-terminal domain-containing protein [Steroidobacteraceae bacterium]|nr:glycoside hydrolase family 3 C-terminal domain-containing protein [Steroidobacteraceae bacterium]